MQLTYFFVAGLLSCLVLAHLLKGGMSLNTCAGWVVVAILHGLLFKPLFVFFDFPSADLLDFVLFQKLDREMYWEWGIATLLPYFAFFVAMSATGKYQSPRVSTGSELHTHYFSNMALSAFLFVAVAGAVGFFIQFPQLLEYANKNTLASEDLADYDGGGIWRTLVEFAYVISICSIFNIAARRAKSLSRLIFLTSAGLWLAFCYLSDQRAAILFSIVTYLIAYNRYVARLTKGTIFLVMSSALVVGVIKTIARIQTGGEALQENLGSAMSNFVGQNFIEIGKTIAIIKAVPDLLNFQYGYTYINSFLLLVPRALFPSKEAVNLDTTIGNNIFECGAFGACGVPPGLLAESYINFGVVGLLVLPVVMGLLIGKLDCKFRNSRNPYFDVFFLYALLYLGMAILGSGISSVLTTLISQGITVAVVCYVCGRRLRPRIPQPAVVPPVSPGAVSGAAP